MVDHTFRPCTEKVYVPQEFSVESLIESELRKFSEAEGHLSIKESFDGFSEKADEGFSEKNDDIFSDKASTTTGPRSPESCRLILEED